MNEDTMLNFLQLLRLKVPESAAVIDSIAEIYIASVLPKLNIDFHFLRYPPGHFYSPVPSLQEFANIAEQTFGPQAEELPGINMHERKQLRLYAKLVPYHNDIPFSEEKVDGLRYYYNNFYFCHADAFWLHSIMRQFEPQKMIEVGSGFSSCIMLDTNEHFLKRKINFTFIEPYPERLLQNISFEDQKNITIQKKPVQKINPSFFKTLNENDILFIDSSHVGKIGSDVLYIMHYILPTLKKGVIVHFHDIFYPFIYPRQWYEDKGVVWNECHFLHTFLQYNKKFEIMLFGNWLGKKHTAMLQKYTPLCIKNIGGSFWMRKI